MTDGKTAHLRRVREWAQANRNWLIALLMVGFASLGFVALHRLLVSVRPHDVRAAFHALGAWQIAAATALTVTSYAILTLYDVLALRIVGKSVPYQTAAMASFTSYSLSHNLGLSLLTGGSARYRIYSAVGLAPADIARVVVTASLTFWSGVTVMAGAALAVHQKALTIGLVVVPASLQHVVGFSILASTAFLLFAARHHGGSIRIMRWTLPLPSAQLAFAQIGLAALDLAAASGALFVLVPDASLHMFPLFFMGYALAIIIALLSHVPGGVGVFEAVIIATLPATGQPGLVAALLAYRLIYYVLPLFAAAILLVIHERKVWRDPLSDAIDTVQSAMASVAPMLLSALTLVGGAILLISGALPPVNDRVQLLRAIVPLPFVEASQIAASLVGTALLLLAPGLYRRLDGAFLLTRALLVAGAIFSITKGVDFEEAIVLLAIVAMLQSTRSAFYRRTALTTQALSSGWVAAIAITVGLSIAIGVFAFKHVEYQDSLWWEFAWKGNASRFLRASFATAVVVVGFMLARMFRAGDRGRYPHTSSQVLSADALATCDRTDALLALTGDKLFLKAETGNAFLMYQVQGRSWIVIGDPVGPIEDWPDLIWRARELADEVQGRLLLYQITARALPVAIDLGLQLVKYGEEARVDLGSFALDGRDAKSLRYAERRAAREGADFDVVSASGVPAILAELRSVSDHWLANKGGSEKAFSVGRFDSAYLAQFDCAVVRHEGRIVAFANIWATANRNEVSVDLMRHADAMPYGTMDFLFVNLMQWAKAEGYRWFNLGIAPLSGIEARRLAPMWARAGNFLYRHGEALYGFEGLRAYKDKFSPIWEPRYVAGPSGVGMARALIDLQTLVGGGRASAARRPRLVLAA